MVCRCTWSQICESASFFVRNDERTYVVHTIHPFPKSLYNLTGCMKRSQLSLPDTAQTLYPRWLYAIM